MTLASARGPEFVVLWVKSKAHVQKYHLGDTLLETSRRAGLPVRTTCRNGECGTCVVHVRKGTVRMYRNAVLSDADIASGFVLACQGVPASPECEIEYD
jgi:3-ketosteroid 9alpha-monooxygenase subunit B